MISPFTNCQWEIVVNLLILLGDLDGFRVVLVKVANIASVGRIDLTAWRYEWRCVVLLIDLLPVDALEERMSLDLLGALSAAPESLVDVTLQQSIEQCLDFHAVRVWKFHLHRQRHAINLMLVLGLVLSERTVAFEEFVDHAAKAEPVSTRVVAGTFAQDFRCHVAVRSNRSVRLLFAVVARQAQVRDANVTVLVQQNVGRLQIAINNVTTMHMLESQDHFGSIELHVSLIEDAVLEERVFSINSQL